jgi:hypothetical protein
LLQQSDDLLEWRDRATAENEKLLSDQKECQKECDERRAEGKACV